ncbi:hypothetical protein BKA63DRAFT_119726 [Paraphoma chrysanthemicola]|nr:hypothetical protein BKA63DRAFT_119726 [Paraphoma chrysanthemicola]
MESLQAAVIVSVITAEMWLMGNATAGLQIDVDCRPSFRRGKRNHGMIQTKLRLPDYYPHVYPRVIEQAIFCE